MKKVTKEDLERILKDWNVHECDGQFDVTRHSPAGEEVVVSLIGDTIDEMANNVVSYYDDFDPEDHSAQIYHAKHYGTEEEKRFFASAPGSLEDLLIDAKKIDEFYYQLYRSLKDAS